MVTLAAVLAGCQQQTTSTPAASTADAQVEANKAAFQRLNDVAFNQGDTTLVDSLLSDNPVDHSTMPPGYPTGKAGLKRVIVDMRTGFPDMKSTVEQIGGEGDKVWAYSVMTGTNTGEFMGNKPTGKPIKVEGFDLVRFENGKMVEHWGVMDNMAMMQQLGMAPTPGASKK